MPGEGGCKHWYRGWTLLLTWQQNSQCLCLSRLRLHIFTIGIVTVTVTMAVTFNGQPLLSVSPPLTYLMVRKRYN